MEKNDYCVNLLFKDSNSLVYEIKTDDVDKDFYEDKKLFGFSYYLKGSKLFYPANKKVINKMKHEVKGKTINGFVLSCIL